jgi:hypothetical protein
MATGLGIDIGSEWIKAVQVSVSGGKVTVTGALKMPRAAGGAASEEGGMHTVPPNLGEELSRARLRRSGCVGLTGKEVVLRYVTTPPMPPEKLRSYIDMQIGERMVVGKKEEGAPALTYDFRILNVHGGLKGDLVIMAAAAKNEFLHGLFAACKMAGVRATRAVPSAIGLAQAKAIEAQGTAEATAILRKADAWKQFNDAAKLQTILEKLPAIIEASTGVFGAVAAPLGNIDKLVVIDQGSTGASGSSSGLERLAKTSPAVVFNLLQQLDALGLNLPAVLKQLGVTSTTEHTERTEEKP